MLNPLKFLRYLVFGKVLLCGKLTYNTHHVFIVVFVICNAIITSVAVWNLSILQVIAADGTASPSALVKAEGCISVVAKDISSYLMFVGASGLVVIFIV